MNESLYPKKHLKSPRTLSDGWKAIGVIDDAFEWKTVCVGELDPQYLPQSKQLRTRAIRAQEH